MSESGEQYYQSYGLDSRDLDQESVLKLADNRLSDHQCQNLVVDFGRRNAWVAADIDQSQAGDLRNSWKSIGKCPGDVQTRWMVAIFQRAIFDAYEQRELVNTLLQGYGISTRTRASMTSPRGKGNLEIVRKMWHWSVIEYDEKFLIMGTNNLHSFAPVEDEEEEDEVQTRGLDTTPEPIEGMAASEPKAPWIKRIFRKSTYRKETDELPLRSPALPVTDSKRQRVYEHATKKFKRESQGQGLKSSKEYTNTLDYADDIFEKDLDLKGDHYHPRMLRLWMWIVMLDDNIILTLHEPLPPFRKDVATFDKVWNTTGRVRKNIRTVLRCLSVAGLPKDLDGSNAYNAELAMEHGALIVRPTPDQSPDLLFYYLFDDWYGTWSLTVDRAHPYTKQLSIIKTENPQLHHIDQLHDIVRRLATMKRVYQSYELVLTRLLEENKHLPSAPEKKLGPLALTRFARLKHRITYLAIGEITECEKEAEGLISLTFNRLNFREVQAVEKLSLLSVTLVKFTLMFLPLSLIMGYFSMDVEGISGKYKAAHFWGAAGVVVVLTTIFLLCVGKLNKIMLGTRAERRKRKAR